jgi:hypothetical protein
MVKSGSGSQRLRWPASCQAEKTFSMGAWNDFEREIW